MNIDLETYIVASSWRSSGNRSNNAKRVVVGLNDEWDRVERLAVKLKVRDSSFGSAS